MANVFYCHCERTTPSPPAARLGHPDGMLHSDKSPFGVAIIPLWLLEAAPSVAFEFHHL